MIRPLHEIEEASGLALDPSTHGSVGSLDELPRDTVERLLRLPRSDQHVALMHLLPDDSHPAIDAFMDAMERGEEPAAWGRGGVLVPAAGFQRLVASTARELLERIESHGRWVALAPQRSAWEAADPSTGAPAVELGDDVGYRWDAPEGTTRIIGPPPLVESPDPRVAALRWITSRIARVAEGEETAEETVRRAVERPSADALVAARVLDRERAELHADDTAVPGFRAPAEWFAG